MMSTEQPDTEPKNTKIDNPYLAMADDAALEHSDIGNETLETLPIGELIEQALSSDEFNALLQACPDDKRAEAIGWAVEFSIVSRELTSVREYLDSLKAEIPILDDPREAYTFDTKKAEAVIKQMTQQLGLAEPLSEADEEAVFHAIQDNFDKNGYYFHSFNGVFEDAIQQNGLQPVERLWDESDLEGVQRIGERVGESMLLGWSNINSAGQISFSGYPELIYPYAVASPEWFAQFTGGGSHIPPRTEGYDKQAFYRRDYDAARQNIELFCDKISSRSEQAIAEGKAYPNLTIEERAEIIQLFDKYWPVLAGDDSQPKLALIERQAIFPSTRNPPSYEETKEMVGQYGSPNSLVHLVETVIGPEYHDGKIDHAIPPEQIKILNLPEFDKVHPRE